MERHIYLITGVMASGKSTVAQRLAERLDRCVHLRGDAFRKMIVSGREEMCADASDEARAQLALRYRITALAAREYLNAGFDVAMQDNYYGDALTDVIGMLKGCPVRVIVLCPDAATVARREAQRGKVGYLGFDVESLTSAFMASTPRVGLWIDNSNQSPDESVDAILAHYADR